MPQWIEFSFPTVKQIRQLLIQFQGGFAPKSCVLECVREGTPENVDANSYEKFEFYPKDSNESQTFVIDSLLSSQKFKLIFASSHDFYGRIIIYNFDILGN